MPSEVAARRRQQLGEHIRAARTATGLTQEKTAHAASLDRSFYVEVETGRHSLTVDRLFSIADALEVPIVSLLEGID
jgi:transcriptional regulator with XRE-family HTH domain